MISSLVIVHLRLNSVYNVAWQITRSRNIFNSPRICLYTPSFIRTTDDDHFFGSNFECSGIKSWIIFSCNAHRPLLKEIKKGLLSDGNRYMCLIFFIDLYMMPKILSFGCGIWRTHWVRLSLGLNFKF